MSFKRAGGRVGVLLAAGTAAVVANTSAYAHANISPPVAVAKQTQLYTLAVPTEKENATTTKVELTPPKGFSIDSFAPAAGWKRDVQSTGSGDQTQINKVTWSGGSVPHAEDAMFQFLALTDAAKTYSFAVRQTYSDGSVVDWSGPESSDTPSPTIAAKSSLGGGGNKTLGIIALALAGIAILVAGLSLFAGSGRRSLA